MNDSKDKIMEEAYKLFLQNSYKEVTIQNIVDKVEMTKGAFYYFFKSKEQLFCKIFNRYFLAELKIDNTKYSCNSLYQFYHDFFNNAVKVGLPSLSDTDGSTSDVNYYAFIFDALKLFPEFRREMKDAQLSELKTWETVVRNARDKGEIKSTMSDEQIASIFIYISNGVGMQSIMEGRFQENKKQILAFWDAFYECLKA